MKKNFICNFILSGLLLLSPLSMFAQRVSSNLPWSVRMVESEMIRCPESWQLDFQPQIEMGLLSRVGIAIHAGCV